MTAADALAEVARRRAGADYRGAREVAAAGVAATSDERSADAAALLVELGRLQEELGAYDEAEATLARAVEMAGSVPGSTGRALVARAHVRAAVLHRSQGRPHDAATAGRRALAAVADDPGVPPATLAEALGEAARAAEHDGNAEEVEALLQQALDAAGAAPPGPTGDGVRALTTGGAAAVRRRQGRYEEAETALREAIAGAEAAFGPASLEVANLFNELGIVYKFSGRFADAEPIYRRSLTILVDAFGTEQHSDVASLYHNLGGLAHARGDFAAAEAPARRSVEIREATVGPDHLSTAADRAALASILDALGSSEEAEVLLRAAIEVFERELGPDDYEVAVNLNNLAAIEQRRGRLDVAEELYRRALAIKRAVLGPGSPETAFTMNNLAVVCRRTGRLEEAEQLYRDALAVLEAGVEATHPSIATTLRNLAKLLDSAGRTEEAEALRARADANP